MKPVLIFRHARTEGPGHFATFLDLNRVPWRLVKLDEGEAVPGVRGGLFAGLGFMGGPMSANDELPWTRPVLELMRDAVDRKVPVIGHCLGGQLLARALGAKVSASPVKEIGWNRVEVEDTLARPQLVRRRPRATSRRSSGTARRFAIPDSGERILRGAHCRNQAYVVGDRHLGHAVPRGDDAGDDPLVVRHGRRRGARGRWAARPCRTSPRSRRRWASACRRSRTSPSGSTGAGSPSSRPEAAQSRKFSKATGTSFTFARTSAIASCRMSFLAPVTRTASPWIEAVHLELAVLEHLHDLLGRGLVDALLHGDLLLHLVAADLLDVAELEEARVDAALGELVVHAPRAPGPA